MKPVKPLLFIALDELIDKEEETLRTAQMLARSGVGFKINLDYVLMCGVERAVKQLPNCPVFVDLKMWNGRRTMMKIIEKLVELKVDYTNAYVLADNELRDSIKIANNTKTKILGLTILTHYSNDYCKNIFQLTLTQTVRWLTEKALSMECSGVILPGSRLRLVQDVQITKVVPGIRPSWYEDDRHRENITPGEAVKNGADILICGSPVMKSSDPVGALGTILTEMEE